MTDAAEPDDHPDLAAEQARLLEAHDLLEAMQSRTDATREMADRAVRDENTVDARIAQWHIQKRQVALRAGSGPLCFGRISDLSDEWYIGRRHVEDRDGNAFVVDWRAPVAAPFYRATAVDPCGLDHRRRFSVVERELVAIFDEDLSDPDSESHSGLPDPLLAELDRERTGQMRDIVSTIAAEQDVIIRGELDRLVIVQGGPGTGKTAVGLHRAAFLLFQHRLDFMDRRVLVVGPNALFLRYIADVLPSLGESSVVQVTLAGLVASRYPVRAEEPDELAALKGGLRMAEVIARSIRARITVPAEGLEMRAGVSRVQLDAQQVEQLQKTALARDLPANKARDIFRQILIQEAWRIHRDKPGVDPSYQAHFTGLIKKDDRFKKSVDNMWPNLSGPMVARDLFTSPTKLKAGADGILSKDEQALLRRKGAKKIADEPWTLADLPLIDEAVAQTTGVPATYGHVVVDEAQDYSPMALRMLGRRADKLSMTVLGDLAQATKPAGVESWDDAARALGADPSSELLQVSELTVGYRVPATILSMANGIVPVAAPGVTPARSVRPGGAAPLVLEVDAGEKGATVVAEVEALREKTSSVAVVGVEDDLDVVEAALNDAGVPVERVGRAGLPGADAVALVDADRVKGLEFDAVIVVEPLAIIEDPDRNRGLRRLYVALTRSVQHLGMVHSLGLPTELVMTSEGP